ncbi:DEAD/DEAH box helicase [Mumia sp. zg.B21]|uniref:DEAD/DEAH box helicase n=1 Tax=Mumia sp. zg.B21 TaxID=2855447 RepID=UPI001C6E0B15|nr:DEAD/DEAH box helicase [Mumia sp. zg.B21]MBW9208654.1 DEAD/DEAH box helicase [Mumia sp. zg.B21]
MNRDERKQLRALVSDVERWGAAADAVTRRREEIDVQVRAYVDDLRTRVVTVAYDGRAAWRAIPLTRADARLVELLAHRANLPALTDADHAMLRRLDDQLHVAHDVAPLVSARRFFAGRERKAEAAASADVLRSLHAWGSALGLGSRLEHLARSTDMHDGTRMTVSDLLEPSLGLADDLAHLGRAPEIVPGEVLHPLAGAVAVITRAVAAESSYRDAAKEAGEAVRGAAVDRLLAEMPIDALKDATRDRLRLGPLRDAQVSTIAQVLAAGRELASLPGLGPTTATQMVGAARTLWQITYDETPVRVDVARRDGEATRLLDHLASWDAARATRGATADLARTEELGPLASAVRGHVTHVLVLRVAGHEVVDLLAGADAVVRRAAMIATGGRGPARPRVTDDPWDDFLARPADYFAMLAELGFLVEDDAKTHGDLPDEIIEAVRALELKGDALNASLRGYQSFAARFALVQRKVIIGDEMGLGKTVEALAVFAHLHSAGETHFVVVCPAAVVTNWTREVASKSTLRAFRVHGPNRDGAAQAWVRRGGVAVTTYETLGRLDPYLDQVDTLSCVVVDEAHYIKNPAAQRSQRTAALLDRAERAVLLTGTPLENRVEEFRNLVGYVRPDLVVDVHGLAPHRFRRQVAPAYLRRNQEDVLDELPGLVEVDEWLPMTRDDERAYREAVVAGNFMAMRQAAMLASDSQKMERLIDVVEEAEANDRRVIVFSHFREVLSRVARELPGPVFGPLTGSVPAAARQDMVDKFAAAGNGAVLVAQIVAGGVGLNIQAASVVIICEPQLKPTTEAQAVARAHRMGQLKSVQVHRLLSEDGVDRRITEILAEKRRLFDDFARVSDTAESAPEALDISEGELAREVVATERKRLLTQDLDTPGK